MYWPSVFISHIQRPLKKPNCSRRHKYMAWSLPERHGFDVSSIDSFPQRSMIDVKTVGNDKPGGDGMAQQVSET